MDQYKDITKSLELVYENQARRELIDCLIQEGYDVEGITVDNVIEYCVENYDLIDEGARQALGKGVRWLKRRAEQLTGFGARPRAVVNPETKATTLTPTGGKRRGTVIGGTGTAVGVTAPEQLKAVTGNVLQRIGGAAQGFAQDPAQREAEQNRNEIIRLQQELERRKNKNNNSGERIKNIFDFKDSADLFDIVKGHLVSEGYAKDEKAAIVIMANMSEEWRQSILKNTGV
jgi:hypothetical protein